MKIFRLICLLCILFVLTACSEDYLVYENYEASFIGHMVELNGEYAALSDFYPGQNYLKLYADGTGVIAFSGDEDEVTWSGKDGVYSIDGVQGGSCPATFSDGLLKMELDGGIVTYVAKGAKAPEIPTEEAPNYDTNLYTPYGMYHGLTANVFGEVVDMVEYYKDKCYIRLDPDGMGVLCLGGNESTIAWELENKQLTICSMSGVNSFGSTEDGILVLDYMETGIQLAFAKEGAVE